MRRYCPASPSLRLRWFGARPAATCARAARGARLARLRAVRAGARRGGLGKVTCAPSRRRSPPSVTTTSPGLSPAVTATFSPSTTPKVTGRTDHGSIRIDEVDERRRYAVGRAAAHGGVGHDDLIVQDILQQLDIDELIGKQRAVGVVEHRPQLDGAGRYVDRIIDGEQFAIGDFGDIGASNASTVSAAPCCTRFMTADTLSSGMEKITVIGCS